MQIVRIVSLAIAGFVLSAATAEAGDPVVNCQRAKLKAAARYGACRLSTISDVLGTDRWADQSRCREKYSKKWLSAESRVPDSCPSSGDEAAIEARIFDHAQSLSTLLAGITLEACPASQLPATGQTVSFGEGDDADVHAGEALAYTDNGDGTITDINTGLMWEKKTKIPDYYALVSCNATVPCPNPHVVNNRYSWTASGTAYDGSLVTIFLDQLNNGCSNEPATSCESDADCVVPGGPCGFAGHRDWRLPNLKEMVALVDIGRTDPAIDPAFHAPTCDPSCSDVTNPACSCNGDFYYWTSTSFSGEEDKAWDIYMPEGDWWMSGKGSYNMARAVRGGVSATAPAADDAALTCQSSKLTSAARYAACRLMAESKALKAQEAAVFTRCLNTFASKWQGTESDAGAGVCPSELDEASIETRVTDHAATVTSLLANESVAPECGNVRLPATGQALAYGEGDDGDLRSGGRLEYVDNGDGTITDANTGLMWEKKVGLDSELTTCSGDSGSCTNPHDADNAYSWGGGPYEGSVVSIFLEQLNNHCSEDATVSCSVDLDCVVSGGPCGFAGHRDWRLPNLKELSGLMDFGAQRPAVDVALHGVRCGPSCTDITDPQCSCTAADYPYPERYWTSSTDVDETGFGWYVGMREGNSGHDVKAFSHFARAVRGGL